MDRTEQKGVVLKAAKDRLRTIELELRERVNELKAVTIGDDNAESASQTESTHGSDIDLMNSLSEQIDHIQREQLLLDGIDPAERHTRAEFGSVVHTDQRNFLVVTGIDEFKAGGSTYLGLSPRAPLFQALQGKAKGDKVVFNTMDYRIEDVF